MDKTPGKGRGKYAEAGDEATQDEKLAALAEDVATLWEAVFPLPDAEEPPVA
jgi:hypothetical protein